MVCYRGALIKGKVNDLHTVDYNQITTVFFQEFDCVKYLQGRIELKGEELGKGIIIVNAELWTGLWIRFAMHLVQIKLHEEQDQIA